MLDAAATPLLTYNDELEVGSTTPRPPVTRTSAPRRLGRCSVCRRWSTGPPSTATRLFYVTGHHAEALQLLIEYDPQPPFDAGAPDKAPQAAKDLLAEWRPYTATR